MRLGPAGGACQNHCPASPPGSRLYLNLCLFGTGFEQHRTDLPFDCYEIVRPSSFFETPIASKDLTSNSIDTRGSPASILATRDWLDSIALASVDLHRNLSKERPFLASKTDPSAVS
jgi:hypothetical protein